MDLSQRALFKTSSKAACAKSHYDIKKAPYEDLILTELMRNVMTTLLSENGLINPREEDQSLTRILVEEKNKKILNKGARDG